MFIEIVPLSALYSNACALCILYALYSSALYSINRLDDYNLPINTFTFLVTDDKL